MNDEAKARIEYAVRGRIDAGLPFCRGRFVDFLARACCGLGAMGARGRDEAMQLTGMTEAEANAFIVGWDGRDDGSFYAERAPDAYAFGQQMAALAFGSRS